MQKVTFACSEPLSSRRDAPPKPVGHVQYSARTLRPGESIQKRDAPLPILPFDGVHANHRTTISSHACPWEPRLGHLSKKSLAAGTGVPIREEVHTSVDEVATAVCEGKRGAAPALVPR